MRLLLTLLVCFLLSISNYTFAQSGMGYSSFYFSAGANMLNFNDLNSRLDENKLPMVNNLAYNGTIGFYGVLEGKVMLGLEGTIFMNKNTTDSLENSLKGGYGIFQVGYSIVRKRRLEFFPLVGVGYGQLSISVRDIRPDGFFSNYFTQQPNVRELVGRGPIIQLGAGIQYRLGQRNGYYVGLRGGYVNMGNSGWRFSSGQLVDGPVTAGSSFYLNFTVGMFLHDRY